MSDKKPIILLTGPYLPGKKFGGPVKSILNLVNALKNEFEFKIVTGDRDLGSKHTYANVTIGKWNNIEGIKVFYTPQKKVYSSLKNIIRTEKYDLIYCSSFFSKPSVVVQFFKYMHLVKSKVIVAPRGEFETSALGGKYFKKKLFLFFYTLLKMQNRMIFTCTSEHDKLNIKNTLGRNIEIFIAGNIPDQNTIECKGKTKKKNTLKLVTVSRMCPHKNIKYSIKLIDEISNTNKDYEKLQFHIYGHIEDRQYYDECKTLAETISKRDSRNEIKFMGPVDYEDVIPTISKYHVFLFPSKSENYGHVIHEALLAGCPVIISDTTPWRNLEEKNVGFALSLTKKNKFIEAILFFLKMDSAEYNQRSVQSFDFGCKIIKEERAIKQSIELLNSSIVNCPR